jgi:hypothetical protein
MFLCPLKYTIHNATKLYKTLKKKLNYFLNSHFFNCIIVIVFLLQTTYLIKRIP